MANAVTGKGLATLEDQISATASRRHTHVKARSRRSSRSFIVCGVAIMIMLGSAAILLRSMPDSRPAGEETARHDMATITLPAEGAYCRQLAFDNRSGRMMEAGSVRCVGSDDPAQLMRERYSGGRLETIRKAFSGGR